MSLVVLFLLFALGLAVGSFLGAYTYRRPKGKSVSEGRSFCPNCGQKIAWFDNVPIISFLLLRGKCRSCRKKISLRYPAIELATAFAFVSTILALRHCATTLQNEVVCAWGQLLGQLAFAYFLFLISILIAIFVIDIEHKLILDNEVYFLFLITFFLLLIFPSPTFFPRLSAGFSASLFLLIIHMATAGRGMGLGDVKLALPAGLILGWPGVLVWFYLSFLIGAISGLVLIVFRKAKFGKSIAFGPFLVISLLITLVVGNSLFDFLFPFQ